MKLALSSKLVAYCRAALYVSRRAAAMIDVPRGMCRGLVPCASALPSRVSSACVSLCLCVGASHPPLLCFSCWM
jgi:hypothetical protein